MVWSRKAVDRVAAGILYLGICAVIVWTGIGVINHAMEVKFYKDYLLKWESSMERCRASNIKWPHFNGSNHAEYMKELIKRMTDKGIEPPRSNTLSAYCYVLDRIGWKPEHIFVLCLEDRIIIYGLSKRTFKKIDAYIDGTADPYKGRLRGKVGKDKVTVIAIWGV